MLTSKVVKEDLTEGVIDSKDFTLTADNENSDGKITNAFDNNSSTIWHTQWSPDKKPLPAVITIDMKKNYDIKMCLRDRVGQGKVPHSWFAGFVDSDDLPLAFVALVENGGGCSAIAGSAAAQVLRTAAELL